MLNHLTLIIASSVLQSLGGPIKTGVLDEEESLDVILTNLQPHQHQHSDLDNTVDTLVGHNNIDL